MFERALELFKLAACGRPSGVIPSLYDNLNCNANGEITLRSVSDILVIVGNLLRILIAVSGMLAVAAIIGAGIYYVISAGDPSKVKKAKDILNNSALGLILVISAYAAVTFVAGQF
jgi:hypothetical protein